ncbi:MAG: Cytochrome bo(3) ubiquinol oxidase subunit 2 [Chlamydiae bacterium]|nr:Cytochrome bo(3) ubiquinol oxidase subunit 2 [Chlamydiota bacterium]
MTDKSKSTWYWLVFSAIIVFIILIMQPLEVYLFIKDNAILFPKGIIGLKQRDLLLLIQAIMLIFIFPIYLFTFIFSWWYRADNKKSKYDPHLVDHKVAEFVWWGVPLVLTAVVAVITWIKTHELDPYKPIESDKKPIKIEVVALQWKWLFIYPEEKIATVNYIQIPKNTPIHFMITADAPMNSFWIPRLGGQIYAMPGMRTELFLLADEEGKFRGSSAQISGKGFAGMTFVTEASTDESYKDWVQSVKQSAKGLDWAEYKKLAAPSENNPVEYYQLKDETVFQNIIMKYMKPPT